MALRQKALRGTKIKLKGLSFFGVGASWEITNTDRDAIRAFLAYLEDRRALYVPTQLEVEGDVRWSVEDIRKRCTEALGKLGEGSSATPHVRAIRQACRRYMTHERNEYPNLVPRGPEISHHAGWLIALGELRAIIGFHIGVLAAAYDIELEDELAGIVPLLDDAVE
jgi:hypothetical protein